jgi:surface polysaccharide O-acyltransferase-like enzyme
MKIEKSIEQKHNILWLDTLRALATIGVIIVHVSSPLVNMTYGKNMEFWWYGNIADSIVRFAVPLFLMLSGATLLNKEYGLMDFYKKRISRVLFPFLFWLVVYFIYRFIISAPNTQPIGFQDISCWVVSLFLKDGGSKHLWYIYMILFIYLFVPFIGKELRKLSDFKIQLMLIGWIIISFLCKTMPINQYSWSGGYGDKLLGYFLHSGYLVLGYYISKQNFSIPKVPFYSGAIFFICAAATSIVVYFLSQHEHRLNLNYYSYFTPLAILQSTAIFVWIKEIEIQNKYVLGIQSIISNYSYGIYLVHIMVIGIFFRYGIFWTMAHPLLSMPLVTILTLFTSFIIIYLLRKIPYGKYVAG